MPSDDPDRRRCPRKRLRLPPTRQRSVETRHTCGSEDGQDGTTKRRPPPQAPCGGQSINSLRPSINLYSKRRATNVCVSSSTWTEPHCNTVCLWVKVASIPGCAALTSKAKKMSGNVFLLHVISLSFSFVLFVSWCMLLLCSSCMKRRATTCMTDARPTRPPHCPPFNPVGALSTLKTTLPFHSLTHPPMYSYSHNAICTSVIPPILHP